jgi:hypothetical protein
MVKTTTSFTVSVTWDDKDGQMKIPFNGIDGADVVKYTSLYSKITQSDDNQLIIDVKGLDVATKYQCEYVDTNSKTTKTAAATFVPNTFGEKISCGAIPNGFAIAGIYSAVKFSLLNLGTKEYVLNGASDSDVLTINTCQNGIKDGTETDKDCGGKCVPLYPCQASQKCKITNDCQSPIPCTNGQCGLDGLSAKNAGSTCKAIKIQFPKSSNGIYYLKGPKDEFKNSPKRAWCWQTDRDGGGWMMGVKIYYPGQGLGRSGQGARGNVNDAIQHLGNQYKMDDKDIRKFLGQPNPNNDDFSSGKSTFSWMLDQSKYGNSYYSSSNREYIIGKKYTARWRMYVDGARILDCLLVLEDTFGSHVRWLKYSYQLLIFMTFYHAHKGSIGRQWRNPLPLMNCLRTQCHDTLTARIPLVKASSTGEADQSVAVSIVALALSATARHTVDLQAETLMGGVVAPRIYRTVSDTLVV